MMIFFEHRAVNHLLYVELQFGGVGDFNASQSEVFLVLVEVFWEFCDVHDLVPWLVE